MKPAPWSVRLALAGVGMGSFSAGGAPSPIIRGLLMAGAVACATYVILRFRRLLSSLPPESASNPAPMRVPAAGLVP